MERKGFTLVESVVVLGLLGLLLSFCLPAYSQFSSSLFLNAAAKTIASHLRHIQGQALLEQHIINSNLDKLGLPSSIKVKKAPAICFSPSGAPPPGRSGTIILENQRGKTKKIIVSSSGRVRIE